MPRLLRLAVLVALASAAWAMDTRVAQYHAAFGIDPRQEGSSPVAITELDAGERGNVAWPGETPHLIFRLRNRGDQPLTVAGTLRILRYATRVAPGENWGPEVTVLGEAGSVPLPATSLAAQGTADVALDVPIGAACGGYAAIAELGAHGRHLAALLVRVLPTPQGLISRPTMAQDLSWDGPLIEAVPRTFARLGIRGARYQASYEPPGARRDEIDAALARDFGWTARHGVACMLMVGGGQGGQPFDRGRPWLDERGRWLPQGYLNDSAWSPALDADFRAWVAAVSGRWGWPKGSLNAWELWNEPWNGMSISCWCADDERYREMFRALAAGLAEARTASGVQVIAGGAGLVNETWDKFFATPELAREFLPLVGFTSIHYQVLGNHAGLDPRLDHGAQGRRVELWDTESWLANDEQRYGAFFALMRATGHDRVQGIYPGNIYLHHRDVDGQTGGAVSVWAPGAALAAANALLGQRPYREQLFPAGLPFGFVFAGLAGPDDGTVAIVGDLSAVARRERLPFRSVYGLAQGPQARALSERLAGLGERPAEPAEAQRLGRVYAAAAELRGARMTLAADPAFLQFDAVGNLVPPGLDGRITIGLDSAVRYLRSDGSPGSFARLLAALRAARIDGLEPVAITLRDPHARPADGGQLVVELANVLNRPLRISLQVDVAGLVVADPVRTCDLPAHGTTAIDLGLAGPAGPGAWLATVNAVVGEQDGAPIGTVTMHELLRTACIATASPAVDGTWSAGEWDACPPYIVPWALAARGTFGMFWERSRPVLPREPGSAELRFASDARGVHLIARITDTTPQAGQPSCAGRDDDDATYPEVSWRDRDGCEGFAVLYEGTVAVPESGSWTFSVATAAAVPGANDELVKLRIGGQDGAPDCTLNLVAGQAVPLRLWYANGCERGLVRLEARLAERPAASLPASCFRTPDGRPGLEATYARGTDCLDGELLRRDRIVGSRIETVPERAFASPWIPDEVGPTPLREMRWPSGVRRYSYRQAPTTPSGVVPVRDNLQIAFSVLPPEAKDLRPALPGLPARFQDFPDTDYEFALNQLPGGPHGEVFRLLAPGMPRTDGFAKTPVPAGWGPVAGSAMACTYATGQRIVEATIPWSAIPAVRAAHDAGRPIGLAVRINDDGGRCYEIAAERSASKVNRLTLHGDWLTHWSSLRFGWR